MDAELWDERYRSQEQLFSGAANGVLVAEVAGLLPGRALDAGCGEGGDARWLVRHGWRVTAVDISRVALQRAAAAAEETAGQVTWAQADLTTTAPPDGPFDLVSAQYFPLPHQPDHSALRGLLDAVAPGGTLLFVGHDLADLSPSQVAEFDPAGYYQPGEVADLLDGGWTVLVNEVRPRTAAAPAGTHHTHDVVLRARRTAGS